MMSTSSLSSSINVSISRGAASIINMRLEEAAVPDYDIDSSKQ